MQKGDPVIYVEPITTKELHPDSPDPKDRIVYGLGLKDHVALVTAINGLNEGHISVAYIDVDAPERDNVRQVFDIPHEDHASKDENNPDLTRVAVNCWKEPQKYLGPEMRNAPKPPTPDTTTPVPQINSQPADLPPVVNPEPSGKTYTDGCTAVGPNVPDHCPHGYPEQPS